jgi:hypothetical protein
VIRRVDFCKNIILQSDKSNINWFLFSLAEYDLGNRFNFTNKVFQNEKRIGKAVSFYNGRQAIKFYNKLEELLNRTKLLLTEKSVIQEMKAYELHSVLRIERSLQNYNAVNSILSKHLPKKFKFTLSDIWSKELAQKMLLELIDELTSRNVNLFNVSHCPEDLILLQNLLQNRRFSQSACVFTYGKIRSILGEKGGNEFLLRYMSKATINSNRKKYTELVDSIKEMMPSTIGNIWSEVSNQINKFETINRDNWKKLVIR